MHALKLQIHGGSEVAWVCVEREEGFVEGVGLRLELPEVCPYAQAAG